MTIHGRTFWYYTSVWHPTHSSNVHSIGQTNDVIGGCCNGTRKHASAPICCNVSYYRVITTIIMRNNKFNSSCMICVMGNLIWKHELFRRIFQGNVNQGTHGRPARFSGNHRKHAVSLIYQFLIITGFPFAVILQIRIFHSDHYFYNATKSKALLFCPL